MALEAISTSSWRCGPEGLVGENACLLDRDRQVRSLSLEKVSYASYNVPISFII